MKRRILKCGMIGLLIGMVMLNGCGSENKEIQGIEESEKNSVITENSKQNNETDSEQVKEKEEAENPDSTPVSDVNGEKQDDGVTLEAEEDADDETDDNIQGNGSYFVRKDGCVYFHKYEASAFEDFALFGDFLSFVGDSSDKDTALYRFDESTGETTELLKDGCTGKLYLCGDRFYCQKQENGQPYIYSIYPDEGYAELFGPGYIGGVSDDGSLIAMQMYVGDDLYYRIYDDQGSFVFDGPDDIGGMVEYCGFCGDSLVYIGFEEDEAKVYAADKNGTVFIGKAPGYSGYGGPDCDQFIADGDTFCCVLGYYGGPVDTIEDYYVISGTTSEGSLKEEQHGYDEARMPGVRDNDEPFIMLKDGELSYGPYEACSIFMDHSSGIKSRGNKKMFRYGDLYYCGKDGEQTKLIGGFIKYRDYGKLILDTAQVIGDYAYMMVAKGLHVPEEDFKIYRAYSFEDMYYIRIPLKENSKAETILGSDWEKAAVLDIGDIYLGEGAEMSISWDEMAYYLEGDWELQEGAEGKVSADGLKMSFAQNGIVSFRYGDSKDTAQFAYNLSDLFSTVSEQQNRLDIAGVAIADGFKENADDLMGCKASFQLLMVNDRGKDILLLREIGDSTYVFSNEVLGRDNEAKDFWIFKRKGDGKLTCSDGQDELLRIHGSTFAAFRISEDGKSCTLIPVGLSMDPSNANYYVYRLLDKGYGPSTVEYEYGDTLANDNGMTYAPAMVSVTTDDDGRITQIKELLHAGYGCYYIGN